MNSFSFLRKFERRKGQVLNRLGIPYAIIREDGSILFELLMSLRIKIRNRRQKMLQNFPSKHPLNATLKEYFRLHFESSILKLDRIRLTVSKLHKKLAFVTILAQLCSCRLIVM
jgi:hypothetical protein